MYVNQPSVSDKGIITANGIAFVEFAGEVLGELGVYDEDTLKDWYDFFKTPGWMIENLFLIQSPFLPEF